MKTLEQRQNQFKELLNQYSETYSQELLEEFHDYWTEINLNGRKMRFEKEKTFSLGRRLKTWYKNSLKWDKPKIKNMNVSAYEIIQQVRNGTYEANS